nr:hypothetical protein [Trebonia sp.]
MTVARKSRTIATRPARTSSTSAYDGGVVAKTVRVFGAPAGPAGVTAVELGLDERDHVHAVDAQEAPAVAEKRIIDVRAFRIDTAHHDTGQVGFDEPGATQVHAGELRCLQLVGPGER